MDEDLKQIIASAIQAPSGDNCQPWKFKVDKNQIYLINLPERDTSLYSWGQRASYVAHGAAIENISVTAIKLGYETHIELFPNKLDQNLVAKIVFDKNSTSRDDENLYDYISARTTNRKPYKKIKLTPYDFNKIIGLEYEPAKVFLCEEENQKNNLANIAGINERLLFENNKLHNFFYDHISWTKAEDHKKKFGFYIKTLEIPLPAQPIVRLLKNWRILKFFNRAIKFSHVLAKQNSAIYDSSSSIGIITIPTNSPEDFVAAGRLIQKIWLTATKLGLSIQPLTGVIFFMLRIKDGSAHDFSDEHKEIVMKGYSEIEKIFKLKGETVAMMFRIGYPTKPPSAKSARFPVEEFIDNTINV